MPITATTRRCPGCHDLVEGGPATCPRCQRALCPPVETWPPSLILFIALRHLQVRLYPWRTRQDALEQLLRDCANGTHTGIGANRAYPQFNIDTPAADIYPVLLEEAKAWRASGLPVFPPATAAEPERRSA